MNTTEVKGADETKFKTSVSLTREVHARATRRAHAKRWSLSTYVESLLEQDLAKPIRAK